MDEPVTRPAGRYGPGVRGRIDITNETGLDDIPPARVGTDGATRDDRNRESGELPRGEGDGERHQTREP